MPLSRVVVTLGMQLPRVNDRLDFQGKTYEVTGLSHYRNDEGFEVEEWCCETSNSECYLLRECRPGQHPRWFFTRWIKPSEVMLPGGGRPPRWKASQPAPQPPPQLLCREDIFQYDDATDGTYDDDGRESRKITWDYWNAKRQKNLAIELWSDGGQDFYTGAYIDSTEMSFLPPKQAAWSAATMGLPANPFFLAAALAPAWYCGLLVFFPRPFDETLATSLGLAYASALALSRGNATARGLAAALGAGLCWLFWWFPPLSSRIGLACLLLAPAAMAAACRSLKTSLNEARFLSATAAAFSAGACGFAHYFFYAPHPHTIEQLLLALAPALFAAASGFLIALGLQNWAAEA